MKNINKQIRYAMLCRGGFVNEIAKQVRTKSKQVLGTKVNINTYSKGVDGRAACVVAMVMDYEAMELLDFFFGDDAGNNSPSPWINDVVTRMVIDYMTKRNRWA